MVSICVIDRCTSSNQMKMSFFSLLYQATNKTNESCKSFYQTYLVIVKLRDKSSSTRDNGTHRQSTLPHPKIIPQIKLLSIKFEANIYRMRWNFYKMAQKFHKLPLAVSLLSVLNCSLFLVNPSETHWLMSLSMSTKLEWQIPTLSNQRPGRHDCVFL